MSYCIIATMLIYFIAIPKGCATETARVSPCRSSEFECEDHSHCVIQSWVCDGSVDCNDGSDESPHRCHNTTCRSDQFRCRDNTCIPGFLHCSGTPDCADGSDEENCSEYIYISNINTLIFNVYFKLNGHLKCHIF